MTAIPQDLTASRPARRSIGPLEVFACCWRHRTLVALLARRDILARYRGSLLGVLWSFVNPLLLLGAFLFVFSTVFEARWRVPAMDKGHFALILFPGLIVFWLFTDCFSRAPKLMRDNSAYIKNVVFPLEVLPWVVLLSALFHAGASSAVYFVFYAFITGTPPWTAVLFPVVLVPLALFALGTVWFLSAIGVFVRDLAQVTPVATTLLLFLSPLFYPLSAVPESIRGVLQLNPLAHVIGEARGVLLWGEVPDWGAFGLASGLAWLVAWLGLLWFNRTRKGFADVV